MPKICISGCNITDGMGDLAHIINIGEAVQARYRASAEVVYEFQWLLNSHGWGGEGVDQRRVKELIEKLKFHGIIEAPDYDDRLTAQQMLDELNRLNTHKLHIFSTEDIVKDFGSDSINETQKEHFGDADLWIVASAPAFGPDAHSYHNFSNISVGLGMPGKTIFCLEHCANKAPSFADVSTRFPTTSEDEHEILYSPDDKLVMGFGHASEKTMAGLLLEKSEIPTPASKINQLLSIQNQQFHQLLHGDTSLQDIAVADNIVQQTIFVPNYHSHGREHALTMFLNFYSNTLNDDGRDVLMQGKFDLAEFNAKSDALIAAGFTQVEYFDKQTGDIKNITLVESPAPGSEKTLKVFTGRLNDKDYQRFTHCADIVAGCSGDNTLQDAINTGAVPLFMPNKGKAEVLADLKDILAQEGGEEQEACLKFLTMYEQYENYAALAAETSGYTPELLAQWPAVCANLKAHHNTYDMVFERVEHKLGISPIPEDDLRQQKTPDAVVSKFQKFKNDLNNTTAEKNIDEEGFSIREKNDNPRDGGPAMR